MLALSLSAAAASVFSQLNSGRFLPFLLASAACVATVFLALFGWAALLHAFGGRPHGAVVRLASYELRYYHEAAADAEEKYGMVSDEGAPFVRWTPEPEAELARARRFVLWVIAGNNLSLLLLFVAGRLVTRAAGGATWNRANVTYEAREPVDAPRRRDRAEGRQ
jgi:hypothetical protein